MKRLYIAEGAEFRFVGDEEIRATAHRLVDHHYRCGEPVLDDPARLHACLRLHLGLKDYEVFGCLHLTKRHRLIAMTDLFRGTIDRCGVYACEVVKAALLQGGGRRGALSQSPERPLETHRRRTRRPLQPGPRARSHRCAGARPPDRGREGFLVPAGTPALIPLTPGGAGAAHRSISTAVPPGTGFQHWDWRPTLLRMGLERSLRS
jgi:hypothetical protein